MPLVVPGINSKDTSDKTATNPVIPNEEQVKSGVYDKKDSTAKALPEHFSAQPGPVIPEDPSVLGKKENREELLARAKELNKD